jgi:hypothetical protein
MPFNFAERAPHPNTCWPSKAAAPQYDNPGRRRASLRSSQRHSPPRAPKFAVLCSFRHHALIWM